LFGFFTPLDRTLCGNESTTPRNASASLGERVLRDREGGGDRWRHYQLLGAAGAAAEGAEEEDGDGAGEEKAGRGLERGGIVIGGEERRRAQLHGALAFCVDGAGVGGWLRCGGRRRRRRFRFGVYSSGAAAGKRERRGEGEAASWGEAVEMKARGAVEEQHGGSGVYECAAQRGLSLLCLVARIMERDFFQ
jgi:hypothetical protein